MYRSGEPQRADVYLWRATYLDGSVLEERDHGGVEARFEDVDRGRLARFALVEAARRREVVGFDAGTGVFGARGRSIEFCLGDMALTGRVGASYRDVIQYKSAHADWREGAGCSGTVVDAHHIGYRVVLPEVRFEVVLRLDARTGRVGIAAQLAPLEGCLPPAGAFFALVAGVRVDTHAEFEEAFRPCWTLPKTTSSHEAASISEPMCGEPQLADVNRRGVA